MSSSNFIRWCGLACVLGSLVYAAGMSFLFSLVPVYRFVPLERVLLVLLLLGALAALAAMAHLYTLLEEDESYRRIGALVSWVTFIGVALLFSGAFLESLVGAPMQQEAPFERGLGQLVPLFLMVGLPVAVGGLLVLGALTLDSGVLPRWGGAMLVAGNPLVWLILAGLVAEDRPEVVAVPAIAWALVGCALFRAGIRQSQQSSHVS